MSAALDKETSLGKALRLLSAVGTCSELKDDFCEDYLVCVGYRWDSRGFECQRGVRNPFDPCTCPPPREPL